MRREDVLGVLSREKATISGFGVASLSVFGSVGRDEARAGSDVDLLVEFARPVGLLQFVRLQRFLEGLLGVRVDLVTPAALKPQLREQILREAIRAA
jgi:predicted nucleotidyltransferase